MVPMHAKHNLLIFSIIAIAFLSTGALADCLAPHNLCDTEYVDRAFQESGFLQSYYENNQALYEGTGPDALRYPAALFFLSVGRPDDANAILGTAFAADTTLTQDEAVYLAWAEAAYGDGLNATIAPEVARRLDALSGADATPADALLTLTARYLHEKASDPSTTTGVSALTALLQERGDRGWPSEVDPTNLARVVVALAALYNQAGDATLQRLAEMNLDILTARFAALDAGGALAGIRAGDTLGSGAYDPESAPWNGWAFLLFGTHASRATEPSILVSGYCASAAALGVHEARALPDLAPEAKENFSERHAFSYTAYRDGYLLSGTRDVDGHVFNPVEGFATRATVRFLDDADSFMLLTTQTSDNAAGDPGQQADGGRVYATKDLVIGTAGGSACQEPHLFLSRGFEYADGYADGTVKPVSDLILIHHVASDTYWAFRFLGGQRLLPVAERYAPLANALPVYDRSTDEGFERGAAIIPVASDKFVLQRIPSSFIDGLLEDGASIEDIADAVAANTSFTETDMNALQYTTRYTAQLITYSYTPGVAFQKNSVIERQTDFSLRNIAAANYPYLARKSNGVWRLQGLRNGGSTPYYLELNFASATKNATEGTYGCDGTVEAPTETGVQPTTPPTQLAFLAASLLQDVSGDYVMDCGTPDEVLPNPQSIGSLVIYACVLERGDDRIIGLIYDPSQPDVLLNILQDLKAYYPFTTGATPPPPTACNDIADTAQPGDLVFHSCGAYSGIAVYLSPNANALVLSKGDANPFTSGVLDSVVDFFSGLFGTPSGQGADPATSGSFIKAYFSKRGVKRVDARVTAGEARVRFENLASSVEPLRNVFGANAQYLAGGHVQELITSTGDLASWKAVTAALRLQDGGTPADFTRECGNHVLEYGEDCDPAADANGVVRACDALSSKNVTCVPPGLSNECTLNTSQCAPACQDLDQDGYNVSLAGAACGPADCDDTNRSLARVFDADGNRIDCAGSGDCSHAPYSACPQCVHPDQVEVCGDNADTNCNGLSDREEACPPPSTGGSGDTLSCAQAGACNYVCYVQTTAPPNTNPCPTQWETVKQQGDYTFATRLNGTGVPELRITADGQKEGAVECTLCQEGKCNENEESEMDATTDQRFFTAPQPSPSPSYIFHNGGSKRADVSVLYNNEWKVSFSGGSGDSKDCWNVTGSSNPLVTIPEPSFTCSFNDCPTEWTDLGTQGHYGLALRWAENGYPELRIKVVDPGKENGIDCSALGVWGVPAADGEVVIPWRVTADKHYGNGVVVFDDGGAHATKITVYAYRDENRGSAFRLLAYAYGPDGPSDGTAACWGFNNDIFTDDNAVDFRTIDIFQNGFCHKKVCTNNDDCGSPTLSCSPVRSDLKLCLSTIDGPGACFTPSTPILLANGSSVAMREVKVGDRVLGFDEYYGTVVPTTVEQVLIHEIARDLVVVNGRLEVTPEHLLKVFGKGWVPAGSLRVGDLLQTPRGVEVVQHLERKSYTGKVYNLHNTPFHNYYAGGVLVHNTKATGRPLPTRDGVPAWDEVPR